MRIALAGTSTYDFADPLSWSGIPVAIRRALERRGDVTTVLMGPTRPPVRAPEAVRKVWYALHGEKYFWEREPRIIEHHRAQLTHLIEQYRPDVVLAMCSVTGVAVPRGIPTVVYSDATWRANLDYYETWTGLARRSRRLGERSERLSLRRADQVVVTSDWAARSVTDGYGYPDEKVTVQPVGATHTSPWGSDELDRRARARLERPLALLWVGVEWERKGGAIAVATARALHERGVPVTLHIAGRYPDGVADEPFVQAHGFLDRRCSGALIDELFADSFAFLMPSRAEDAGIVFAEAASYALPSIATRTGGIPTMVLDGTNGQLVDLDETPDSIAERILALRDQPARYLDLCRTSRRRFEKELNWDAAASALVEACAKALG